MSSFGTFETCRWTLKRSAYGEDRKWSADRENGAFDPSRKSSPGFAVTHETSALYHDVASVVLGLEWLHEATGVH
jgi:hypothetical protein